MTGVQPATLSYADALLETMDGALANNPQAVILGQGADDFKGVFGTTLGLQAKYGADRVQDTPLMEEGITGVAVGMALNGCYPILTHIRSDFVLLSANQIINLIAKYRYMFGGLFELPMMIRTVIGRSWGQGAQHSQSLQSLFAHIPGLTVVAPASAQAILETYPYLISRHRGPVITFEHRMLYGLEFEVDRAAVNEAVANDPLGSRLARPGQDVTIVATSIMVLEAIRAAKWLQAKAEIDVEIIDMHCVSGMNADLIRRSVEKTGRLLVLDSGWNAFGCSAEIARIIAEWRPGALRAPMRSLGMAPAPCPTAKSLEDIYYPNQADVVNAAAALAVGTEDHGVPLPEEKTMSDVYKKFRGPF